MKDALGRTIDYARVSVTDRCNLRCVYCMPKEEVAWKPRGEILSFEELAALCRVFASRGIRAIKVSGGEPLARRGLPGFVAALKTEAGIREVTLTTNGLLLTEHLDALVAAGLDAVNISLDTLDAQTFSKMTRYPWHGGGGAIKNEGLERTLAGLRRALDARLRVKINCVPLAGVNEADIIPLARLARNARLAVRFIELMPLGRAAAFAGVPAARVLDTLAAAFGPPRPLESRLGNGPAAYYTFSGWAGAVGVIAAMSRGFCERCNRVRLSASGLLSPCLSSARSADLGGLLRSGAPEREIAALVENVIWNKPRAHTFLDAAAEQAPLAAKAMWAIGG